MATRLERREPKKSISPLVTAEDMLLLAKLPALALAALILPRAQWSSFARGLETVFAPFNRSRLRRIGEGLKIAGVKHMPTPVQVLAQQSHHHIEVLHTFFLEKGPATRIEGVEHLARAQAGGRGAVLWIAHFSFNALASKAAIAGEGFRVHHVSRPEHGFTKSRFGMRFLNPIRIGTEERFLASRIVIDRERPAASMARARSLLKRNDFVSITAGAWEGQLLARVPIAGGVIDLATGAPRLAQATGAPLIPVFTVRDAATGETLVRVDPPIPFGEGDDRERVIVGAVDAFAARHALYLAECAEQWRDWEKLKPRDAALPSGET